MVQAVSYLRTSSLTNCGDGKDSQPRQRDNIAAYAARAGYEVVTEFHDSGVRGTEPVHCRPGFADMLGYMDAEGVDVILVESASRFARDLIVQETGFDFLKRRGITLIAADDEDAFTADTPTAKLVRQVLGAVAEFEKAGLVAKLKRARDKKREATGRCEGPKQAPEAARALAQSLRAQGLSLRAIAAELASAGFLSPSGRSYLAGSVSAMLED